MSMKLQIGTRSSQLALVQAQKALDRWMLELPSLALELVPMSSPGDDDRITDLRVSDPDFFTRFLDDAVLAGEVDAAVHSAKDVPYPVREGLDWFWLPWAEDPRDCLVLRVGESVEDLPSNPVCGISSDRRVSYCEGRFPGAVQKPIRGNIEERIAQLDAGDFDAVIIAGAALNRLGLEDRISEWIPLAQLEVPPAQGWLCITFRADDSRWLAIREHFVAAVTLIGGGPGEDYCTQAGIKALQSCDICLYDALVSEKLLSCLPDHALAIDVGKRAGRYAVERPDVDQMIADYARQGKRVARLKGGDPGIFGRAAQEISALQAGRLPWRVIAGVSSVQVATNETGWFLTRRGTNTGFTVLTSRLANAEVATVEANHRASMPLAFFMPLRVMDALVQALLDEGRAYSEPAAIVFAAGSPDSTVLYAQLGDIATKLNEQDIARRPALLLVGSNVSPEYLRLPCGPLKGRRVLLTGSEELLAPLTQEVLWMGGLPIPCPLIKLRANMDAEEILQDLASYDWITLTSPAAVRCLLELMRKFAIDVREVPKIMVSGPGCAAALGEACLSPDLGPESDFGAGGLIAAAADVVQPGERVLRLQSDRAPSTLSDGLRALKAEVTECVLYHNQAVEHERLLPFDAVVFLSGSAVDAFVDCWGKEPLAIAAVIAIGQPTMNSCSRHGITAAQAEEATSSSCLARLAQIWTEQALQSEWSK